MIQENLERLKKLDFNIFQSISITGIVVSLVAQAGLAVMHKQVDSFWGVYVVWVIVFALSTIFDSDEDGHHHHHDHEPHE